MSTTISIRSMSCSTSPRGIAAVVGVGPKLGRSVACKFAHEGYTVAILARDLGNLSRLAEEIALEAKAQVFAIRMDCSDSKSVREAFEGVLSLGFVEVLVYNACEPPAASPPTSFAAVTLHSFERSLAVSAVGAFHCAQHVIPGMAERGRGTIIFTGSSASLIGFAGRCELSCGKFALRGLSQCLAREFQSSGIHVVHAVIDGVIGLASARGRSSRGEQSPTLVDPDAIAQTYWHIHTQKKGAWTQEIDLRASIDSPTSTRVV
ncbi:3-oxoacyl-[acyl-carrier-protein] reductase FabG-like isoform X1 [Zingiber officinale]|uniref:3-oxoacyl-[acyl-carrier-protein] reductase FabG-like isoform X1 n=1 Tax=Zingiber officinale TaxID=94328 RepID=UPI001C4B0CD0|nr:3-oxoacyl-[acyl-carrier-protein] reductase FabG-like isoform X1 [Zingiber officinale]